MPKLGARRTIVLLCYINFLIFLNRGIIPGAPESFQIFISKSLGVPTDRQNFYMGLLASVYVVATMLFSLLFGYLAITRKPFQLIAWGMGLWIVASIVSGLAYYANSYYLLALGRVLAGAGEASFQCNAMPFINRYAPKKNNTLWLAVFCASVTMGGAGGYVYGAAFASSSLTWAGAFFVAAGLMVPAIALMVFAIPESLDAVPVELIGDLSGALINDGDCTSASPAAVKTAFVGQWWGVLGHLAFMLIALGFAAYTFTLGCFSTFSPTLLIGLGYFKAEADVSLVFGAVVFVTGTVGTIVGGMVLDRLTARNSVTPMQRAKIALNMLLRLLIAATITGIVMLLFIDSKTGFFVWLAITQLFMAALGPAEIVAVMELFPVSRQAMAVAANTVILLVFGDIPAPVVLGWLKDTWAPRCGTIEVDGESMQNPECYLDHSGLRNVLLFSVLWLVWGVLLWAAAKVVLRRKTDEKSVANEIETPTITS